MHARIAATLLVLIGVCSCSSRDDRDTAESSDAFGNLPAHVPSASCAHDACIVGSTLTGSCDPCVAQICASDSFCCTQTWDQQCVNEVGATCQQSCSSGGSGGTGGGGGTGGSTGATSVGPAGGKVTLLHFGLTGDTRGSGCEDTAGYPTDIITAVAKQFEQLGLDFALDLGDHMYVCNNNLPVATAQMNLYMSAIKSFVGTWFMTMGNHECWATPCLAESGNANYVAYMQALAPISKSPYYTFDVTTSLGLATFVIIADNAWDQTQAAWLEQTLATADQKAKYTIIARHHPSGDTSIATNAQSLQIIQNHKYALFLTGHSHLYHHPSGDKGRDLVLGTGGAPLISGGAFHGYALVDQQGDGTLKVTVYDVANALHDSWSVGPN
jgi:hypothetical protein